MSKFKTINIIDSVVISLCVFLLCFSWIQFYIRNIIFSILLGGLITLTLLLIIKLISNKKYNTQNKILNDNKECEKFIINFLLLSNQSKLKTILSIVDSKYSPQIITSYIKCKINDKNFIILDATILNTLDKIAILNLIKPHINKYKKIIIICNNYDENLLNFIKSVENSKIKLIKLQEIYNICCRNEIIIKNNIKIKEIKFNYLSIFKNFFSSTHARGFFFSGLILLFMSLIIPFKNYYIILGTILLIFTIICKLPKMKEKEKFWLE